MKSVERGVKEGGKEGGREGESKRGRKDTTFEKFTIQNLFSHTFILVAMVTP